MRCYIWKKDIRIRDVTGYIGGLLERICKPSFVSSLFSKHIKHDWGDWLYNRLKLFKFQSVLTNQHTAFLETNSLENAEDTICK